MSRNIKDSKNLEDRMDKDHLFQLGAASLENNHPSPPCILLFHCFLGCFCARCMSQHLQLLELCLKSELSWVTVQLPQHSPWVCPHWSCTSSAVFWVLFWPESEYIKGQKGHFRAAGSLLFVAPCRCALRQMASCSSTATPWALHAAVLGK